MFNFEKYLSDFNSSINLFDFILNFLVVAFLAFIVRSFYIKYGKSISDRRKFANNFMILALATLLIITVIKSSIALSLGLVGALSIVRFRAAIKDPEELTYLFLIIGLGIVGGANKPILALVSFALILPLLYLNSKFSDKKSVLKGKTHINISTSHADTNDIVNLISPHLPFLELKRVDSNSGKHFYAMIGKIESVEQLEKIKSAVLALDQDASVSIIDQAEIIL